MNRTLRTLRDAVLGNTARQVEVSEDGTVHEAAHEERPANPTDDPVPLRKPTKLAARTFGNYKD